MVVIEWTPLTINMRLDHITSKTLPSLNLLETGCQTQRVRYDLSEMSLATMPRIATPRSGKESTTAHQSVDTGPTECLLTQTRNSVLGYRERVLSTPALREGLSN